MSPRYRGRFAPSPTGPLHGGSLVAAFGSWLRARQAGGAWVVRVEDLDPPREVAGAREAQLRALAACGLASDAPVLRQSARGPHYARAVEALLDTGAAFECHCSRSDLAVQRGIHRHCVARGVRGTPAIRLRVEDGTWIGIVDAVHGAIVQDVAAQVGDFVLRRADGPWAYQLAVVVDDAAQGVTEVVRGADLLDSTPRQVLLQRTLGLATPGYMHLPLVLADDGHKLSKSGAALPLRHEDPLAALRAAWRILGQDPAALATCHRLDELLAAAVGAFAPARIPKMPGSLLAALHNGNAMGSE